mmetsp:Transcript_12541/g.18318  ORF Transcript_12541/g.18318 Transcript_12541/m.18318 type:complete len:246 (-) Transcript_12541:694-1431(-)
MLLVVGVDAVLILDISDDDLLVVVVSTLVRCNFGTTVALLGEVFCASEIISALAITAAVFTTFECITFCFMFVFFPFDTADLSSEVVHDGGAEIIFLFFVSFISFAVVDEGDESFFILALFANASLVFGEDFPILLGETPFLCDFSLLITGAAIFLDTGNPISAQASCSLVDGDSALLVDSSFSFNGDNLILVTSPLSFDSVDVFLLWTSFLVVTELFCEVHLVFVCTSFSLDNLLSFELLFSLN